MFHVRPHLALCAPAYGRVARVISMLLLQHGILSRLHMTRMASAGGGSLETNEDVADRIEEIVAEPSSRMVFMAAALCDFEGFVVAPSDGQIGGISYARGASTLSGKSQPRMKTDDGEALIRLRPAQKVIGRIRENRKDIFLVGFKTTAGDSPEDQYVAGLTLLKKSSCNLVLANDVHTRLNMVITPERARYHETTNRKEAIRGLVEMAVARSKLRFTRSTIVPGGPVPWQSDEVPSSLRAVVDHCIRRGAYRPFLGSTVGHFAVKVRDGEFLTSRRKTDFNSLQDVGLVRVLSDGDDSVTAFGSRPSVGGQSQRIVFAEHPDADCIVHAHVRIRPDSPVPIRSQREYECGSHECGQNTSSGLQKFDVGGGQYVYAVMLDRHGPNVVFHRSVDPDRVCAFLDRNFTLADPTDSFA